MKVNNKSIEIITFKVFFSRINFEMDAAAALVFANITSPDVTLILYELIRDFEEDRR